MKSISFFILRWQFFLYKALEKHWVYLRGSFHTIKKEIKEIKTGLIHSLMMDHNPTGTIADSMLQFFKRIVQAEVGGRFFSGMKVDVYLYVRELRRGRGGCVAASGNCMEA